MQTKKLWIGAKLPNLDSELARSISELHITVEPSLSEGLKRLNAGGFGLVIFTITSADERAEQVLQEILFYDPRFPVIVHHPEGTLDDAIRFTREGAFYVLLGEIDPERLAHVVNLAAARSRPKTLENPETQPWRRLIIGQSPAIQQICEVIQLIAPRRCTVLITGETGTGKEVIAKAIHTASTRSGRPMVAVNCTALPANLAETELFGHTKGAFTGAVGSRIGRFEQANRSTLFLDEIGDLPLEVQPKLLRALQEQEFERVGSSETVRVDVRVLAASNVNLEDAIQQRRFREDLYYRLNVVPIQIPPLRQRREDIPLLADHFLEKIQRAENAPQKRISPDAAEFLMSLDWPGNVRQLEHAIHKAFALSGDRRILFPGDFSTGRSAAPALRPVATTPSVTIPAEGINFDEVVATFELSLLSRALAACSGNKARAADLLHMKRTTLLAKMKSLEAQTERMRAVGQ